MINVFKFCVFVFNRTVCLISGHKKVVPMLIEDDNFIYSKGCPRCKLPLRMPDYIKNMPPPPSRLNDLSCDLELWNKFREEEKQKIIDNINAEQNGKNTKESKRSGKLGKRM